MRTKRRVALALTVLLTMVGVARAANAPAVNVIRAPDGGSHPQAATDGRGRVHLIYVKGDPLRADLFYVRSDDGGRTFTKPLPVNSHPRSIIITGTVRGPHLAIGKADRVHVAWMGSDEAQPRFDGKKTPMLYARMNDAGDGFEPQRNLIQSKPGLDGGGSIAADGEGNVYVAWHAPRGAGHDEIDRDVWLTRSRDEGATFEPEASVLPRPFGVCACCGMRIFASDNGRVAILIRSAEEMVNRDIHLLVSDDHGKTFAIAASDPWRIGQCVMSTASFAAAGPQRAFAAFETREQVHFVGFATGGPASKVVSAPGRGERRKHPSIAVNAKGEILMAWTVGTGWNKGGALAWQVFDPQGRPVPALSGRQDGLPVWGVPAAVALPDGNFRVVY